MGFLLRGQKEQKVAESLKVCSFSELRGTVRNAPGHPSRLTPSCWGNPGIIFHGYAWRVVVDAPGRVRGRQLACGGVGNGGDDDRVDIVNQRSWSRQCLGISRKLRRPCAERGWVRMRPCS